MHAHPQKQKPCPECGALVEFRHAPASDGRGELWFAYQVRVGPEHERSCRNYREPNKH